MSKGALVAGGFIAWLIVFSQMLIWAVLIYLFLIRPFTGDRFFGAYLLFYAFVVAPLLSRYLWLKAARKVREKHAAENETIGESG